METWVGVYTVKHKLVKLSGHPVTVECSGGCFDGGSWWKEKLQHADSPSYGHWEESPNASPGAFSSWRYFFELLQPMEIISAHELCCSGSTTLIVPPLTTIEAQLLNDCERLGIPAVAGSKVFLSYISFIHVQGEFLAGLPLKLSLDLPLPKFLPLSTLKVFLYHGWGRGSQGFLRSFWKWLTNIVFHPAGSQHVWESNGAVSPDCHCQCGVLG